jgi:hypothetical protein
VRPMDDHVAGHGVRLVRGGRSHRLQDPQRHWSSSFADGAMW